MKITLKVREDKASEFIALIEQMDYVTVEQEKPLFLQELEEAVENLKLVKAGKMKALPAKSLLDEL